MPFGSSQRFDEVRVAELSTEGRVILPAQYRTETRQVIIQERREQQFDALCEADLTPDFVMNLQRALSARGFYKGPASGELNWRTSNVAPTGTAKKTKKKVAISRIGVSL